jgi:hypothetical protein
MKSRMLIMIGLFIVLTGCMGIVEEKELPSSTQSVSWYKNEVIANVKSYDTSENNRLTNERRIARLMDWINISKN